MLKEKNEIKILGFLCNWCSYAGADLAGSLHYEYPTNIRIIRIMCTGRIDPTFILMAFKNGADGVLISGCHPGECHYVGGNYRTERKVALIHRMLEQMGIEKERLRLEWVSAAEGNKFSEKVNDMVNKIESLSFEQISIEVD